MKRFFLTAALGMVCISGFAQGTVNFANGSASLAAMVYDTDGITGLAGTAWSADLYWAPGVVTDSTLLTTLNQPATFSTIPRFAGFFFGSARTLDTRPGLPITAQVRVWDTASGASWAAASAVNGARIGESILVQVIPADPNSLGGGPGIPTTLSGLDGHPWSVHMVPEPSTLGLAGLGLAGMLLLRPRNCERHAGLNESRQPTLAASRTSLARRGFVGAESQARTSVIENLLSSSHSTAPPS